ncbi:MAG: response regulator transcription factor [Kosmotogaceae bacterium]
MKILLVEDEKDLANLIKEALEDEMFTIQNAYDGEEGIYYIENFSFDLIILDILLPVYNGWKILKKIRESGMNTPVLLLTALDEVDDKIFGFNQGADDYLAKPFDIRELLARVRVIIRRKSLRFEGKDMLKCADLMVDISKRKVFRGKKEIKLRKKEYQILRYLIINTNRVVERNELEEHIWGENELLWSDVLRTHIKNLRKKIEKGFKKKLIHTIRGVGYTIHE